MWCNSFINVYSVFSDHTCTSKHWMNEFLEPRATQSEFTASDMALPLSLYKPDI